jgi:MFS family permease
MERSWWVLPLQGALFAVMMALCTGWVARSRMKRRTGAQAGNLVHTTSTFIIGSVGVILFTGLGLFFVLHPDEGSWWMTAIVFGLAILGACTVACCFVEDLHVRSEGFDYRTILLRRDDIRWSDVTSVRYHHGMKWFRIESRTGKVARVSAMLMGLPEFARLALEHLPATTLDDETRALLQETADGNPPPVH